MLNSNYYSHITVHHTNPGRWHFLYTMSRRRPGEAALREILQNLLRPGDRSVTDIFSFFKRYRYLKRVSAVHQDLGIMPDYAERWPIPVQLEAPRLVSIGPDIYQREQRMAPEAAEAWSRMRKAAEAHNVNLQVVSAFRSVDYQAGIIRKKLDKGQDITEILRISAAPGYSEHHTGCAVDVTTPGSPVLEEEFEQSKAFAWLTEHAAEFGFHLSFPRENPYGVAYEPWHWAWNRDPFV